MIVIIIKCVHGGTGRHAGLKILSFGVWVRIPLDAQRVSVLLKTQIASMLECRHATLRK